MSGEHPIEEALRLEGERAHSQYVLAESECDDMRRAFKRSIQRLKSTLKPKYGFSKRSAARRLDTAMQNYCNEVRRLAAEFDQSQQNTK